ncbi:MAG: hypothetical protein GY896_02430 [Gammaproteobacteria bacterium]|nr:hypothetical protein [Gammaproteobacteria bacterium]
MGAARIGDIKYVLIDQPEGWFGYTNKLNFPNMYNLRLDPFERLGYKPHESWMSFEHFFGQNLWRTVFLQQEVVKLAETANDYPPMQAAASFNLDAVIKKVRESAAGIGQ